MGQPPGPGQALAVVHPVPPVHLQARAANFTKWHEAMQAMARQGESLGNPHNWLACIDREAREFLDVAFMLEPGPHWSDLSLTEFKALWDRYTTSFAVAKGQTADGQLTLEDTLQQRGCILDAGPKATTSTHALVSAITDIRLAIGRFPNPNLSEPRLTAFILKVAKEKGTDTSRALAEHLERKRPTWESSRVGPLGGMFMAAMTYNQDLIAAHNTCSRYPGGGGGAASQPYRSGGAAPQPHRGDKPQGAPKSQKRDGSGEPKKNRQDASSTGEGKKRPREPHPDDMQCWGCGRTHKGGSDTCTRRDHPDWNTERVAWLSSAKGKEWAKRDPSVTVLPADRCLAGNMTRADLDALVAKRKSSLAKKEDRDSYGGQKKKVCPSPCSCCETTEDGETLAALHADESSDLVPLTYHHPDSSHTILFHTLMDTGALKADYISREKAQEARDLGAVFNSVKRKVCGGVRGLCGESEGEIELLLSFKNEKSGIEEHVTIRPRVIDTAFDLIIGRQTIKAYSLAEKVPSQFSISARRSAGPPEPNLLQEGKLLSQATSPPVVESARKDIRELLGHEDSDETSFITKHTSLESHVQKAGELEHLTVTIESDGVDSLPENIEQYKEEHTALFTEFKDVFARELSPEPALVPPMEIKHDPSKWQLPKNRQPPRLQSTEKNEVVREKVEYLLKNKMIEPSNANFWSQVLLVPKPPPRQGWRMTVDMRAANEACEGEDWPIPNIPQMMQRIGSQKPKVFCVLDFTEGFFQAPLSAMSRLITAFICFMGIFQWLRVPMGGKGAPSYFQRVMASVVLVGLIYVMCELYIDDVIVHGSNKEEYFARLRKVLERLRKHKVKIHPDKVRAGLSEVEYVGHTINSMGTTFSRDKINEILDFPKPSRHLDLKTFLGLANYLRSNIRNHSLIVAPLNAMVEKYEKNKRLVWTPEADAAFIEIKEAIKDCPTVFFPDPKAPIFVHTDASDYGVGGYVFQTVDSEERPVAFVSKGFTKEQFRWSVPQKECYAIFFVLQKLDYLLRDVKFVLRTDHKNLTYLKTDIDPKVRRWKLAIQEYNCSVEYIKGEDNVVADAMSRLCVLDEEVNDEVEVLALLEEVRLTREEYKALSQVHNSQVGHWGVENTLKRVKESKVLSQDVEALRAKVKKFIHSCPCCQKMSQLKTPISVHPFTIAATKPMHRLCVDTIGPLPPDEKGNQHIIVIIDAFTRFTELYATQSTDAESAVDAFHKHFNRYGAPSEITSDKGSQFVNEAIALFMTSAEVVHRTSIAYSKEENSLVERSNKEVMRHLRAILFEKRINTEWSCYLPDVQRFMNFNVHDSIGVAPASLLYGQMIDIHQGIFRSTAPSHDTSDRLSKFAADMIRRQNTLLEVATTTQRVRNEKHLMHAAPTVQVTVFPVDSHVLMSYPLDTTGKSRPPNKLLTQWKGPLQVVSISSDGSHYTLKDLVEDKTLPQVHIKRLRPFLYDAEAVDPKAIAAKDKGEYFVEQILEHRGNPTRKSTMEFKVRWAGYSPDFDTWEPWRGVRDVDKLHEYLRNHDDNAIRKLAPRQ